MGGQNSGFPIWKSRKRTVEQSLHLDAARLDLRGLEGRKSTGDIAWNDPRTGIKMAGVDLVLDLRDTHEPAAYVSFQVAELGISLRTQRIPLVYSHPHFGGTRHWFLCPLCHEEARAPLRVRKLYLPLGEETAFGCRQCHALTYDCCQDSHRFDGLFRDLAKESYGRDSEDIANNLMKRLSYRLTH